MSQGLFKGLVYLGKESIDMPKFTMKEGKKNYLKDAQGKNIVESTLAKIKLQDPNAEGMPIYEFYFVEWHTRNDLINQEMKALTENIPMYSQVEIALELTLKQGKNHFKIVGIYPAKVKGEQK